MTQTRRFNKRHINKVYADLRVPPNCLLLYPVWFQTSKYFFLQVMSVHLLKGQSSFHFLLGILSSLLQCSPHLIIEILNNSFYSLICTVVCIGKYNINMMQAFLFNRIVGLGKISTALPAFRMMGIYVDIMHRH